MAYTLADANTIKEAIASGAKRVKFSDGREVEYRTLEEMKKILEDILAEVAGKPRPRVSLAKFTRA
jgi:hypothetical protein